MLYLIPNNFQDSRKKKLGNSNIKENNEEEPLNTPRDLLSRRPSIKIRMKQESIRKIKKMRRSSSKLSMRSLKGLRRSSSRKFSIGKEKLSNPSLSPHKKKNRLLRSASLGKFLRESNKISLYLLIMI